MSPIQSRIFSFVGDREPTFKDVLDAFEPLGIKRTDVGRAVINLLNEHRLFMVGNSKLVQTL